MTQFYSRNDVNYSGDVYSIPFDYIDKKEVKVYIDDELWTKWHFLSEHQLTLDEVPEDIHYSNIISVRRETNIEDKVVTYDNNSLLNKENLNKSQDQLLYAVQEIYDNNTQFAIDIRAEVDEKVERVSAAVEKLEEIDASVETSVQKAQEATEQAQIATEKAEETLNTYNEAMAEIDTLRQNSIDEVNQLVSDHTDDLNILDQLIKKDADAIINRVGLNMFDTVLKDHILTYEESKGLALQGTWVYKEAIAGSRYGYPDFYAKCLEEYQNSSNTKQWLKSNVTAVGSLTDNQGVLSGFSTANYATLPKILEVNQDTESWECQLKLSFSETPELATILELGLTSGTLYNLIVGQRTYADNTTSTCFGFYSHSTSFGNMPSYGKLDVLPNTTYFIRYGFDKSSRVMYIDYSLTGEAGTYIRDCAYGIATMLGQPPSAPIIGKDLLNTMTVDLNYSYIKIDGKTWWSGTDALNTNSNGHVFYDITQKPYIDEIFTSTGMAWMYGIDQENERIFLPRNVWFEQMSMDDVGKAVEAGVPNITGYIINDSGAYTGAFYNAGSVSSDINGAGEGKTDNKIGFNASRCSAVYGKSDTVQPNAVKKLLYICVGNTVSQTTITDVVDVTTTENDTIPLLTGLYFDFTPNNISWVKAGEQRKSGGVYTFCYNELVNELTNPKYDIKVVEIKNMTAGIDYSQYWKVNQDDMTFATPTIAGLFPNNRILVAKKEATDNDASWYNLYSDGWVEQGGTDTSTATIQFLKPFIDTGYHFNAIKYGTDDANATEIQTISKTENSITVICAYNGSDLERTFMWEAKGYAQIPTVSEYTENVNLYFKVANAVQNLESMNVARIEATKANKTDVDGQWVLPAEDIMLNSSTALGTYIIDLSDYLPNDGYKYEIYGSLYMSRSDSSGTNSNAYVDEIINGVPRITHCAWTTADGANFQQSMVTYIAVVDNSRSIRVRIEGVALAGQQTRLLKYRRLGTNA